MSEEVEDMGGSMPPVKSMLHGKVIQSQSREIVANVFAFMKREAEFGQQIPLRCVTKRVIAATGVSERSIRRIQREAEIVYSGQASSFVSPRMKHKKLKKTLKVGTSVSSPDSSSSSLVKSEERKDNTKTKESKGKKKGGKMLYPSLEDMKVDQLVRAQRPYETAAEAYAQQQRNMGLAQGQVTFSAGTAPQLTTLYPLMTSGHEPGAPPPYTLTPSAPAPSSTLAQTSSLQGGRQYHTPLYPTLNDYMGLDLSPEVIAANMPEYAAIALPTTMEVEPVSSLAQPTSVGTVGGMVAPLSSQSLGLQRAQVTHGIRELTVCKDANGKVGLRVRTVNNGVFVCVVVKASPAALAGLRFGDQILQVNGIVVAGYSMDQVHKLFRESPINGISVVVRDRPFERTVTLHKDSTGHVGFHFEDGKIVGLVQDSSAARNGLLTDHHVLEVNGQNVVGVADKEITKIIGEGGPTITITIIPSFVFDHMVKKMSSSLMKSAMDHSIPNV